MPGQLQELARFRNEPHNTDGLAQAIGDEIAKTNQYSRIANIVRSKIASGVLAFLIVIAAIKVDTGQGDSLRIAAFLILPLACIWYSDEIGGLTGIRMGLIRPTISQKTPGTALAIAGWILLGGTFLALLNQALMN